VGAAATLERPVTNAGGGGAKPPSSAGPVTGIPEDNEEGGGSYGTHNRDSWAGIGGNRTNSAYLRGMGGSEAGNTRTI